MNLSFYVLENYIRLERYITNGLESRLLQEFGNAKKICLEDPSLELRLKIVIPSEIFHCKIYYQPSNEVKK